MASFTFVPFDRSTRIGETLEAINGALVNVMEVAANAAKASADYVVHEGLLASPGVFPAVSISAGSATIDGVLHTYAAQSINVPVLSNGVRNIYLAVNGTLSGSNSAIPDDAVPLAISTVNVGATALTLQDLRPMVVSKRGALNLRGHSSDPILVLDSVNGTPWIRSEYNGDTYQSLDQTSGLRLFENMRFRMYADDGTSGAIFDFNTSTSNAYIHTIDTTQIFASAVVDSAGGTVGEFTQSLVTAATGVRSALKLTTFGTSTVNDFLLTGFDNTTLVASISKQGKAFFASTLNVGGATTLAALTTTGANTLGNGSSQTTINSTSTTVSGGQLSVHGQNFQIFSDAGSTSKFLVTASTGTVSIVSGGLRTGTQFYFQDNSTGVVPINARAARLGSSVANVDALSIGTSGFGLSQSADGTFLIKHEAVVGSMANPSFQIQNSTAGNVFSVSPSGSVAIVNQTATALTTLRAHASQSGNIFSIQNSAGSTDYFYLSSTGGVHTTSGITHRAGAIAYWYNPGHSVFGSIQMTASNDLKFVTGAGGYTWRNSGDTTTLMSLSSSGALVTAAGANIGGALVAGAATFSGLLTLGSGPTVVSNAAGQLLATALTGTVADGNLSSNVALLNRTTQTWTGTTQQFGGASSGAAYMVFDNSSPNGSSLTWGDGSGWKFRFRSRAGSPISIMELTDNGAVAIPNGDITIRSGRANIITSGNYGYVSYTGATQQAPAFTTRSTGVRLVAEANIGGSSVDYGVGYETDNLWFATGTTAKGFKWYGGTTLAATLSGLGALTTVGATTSSAFIVPATSSGLVMTINSNAAETADTVKFKLKTAAGSDGITMDSNGNLFVAGDFTVTGTQIISGTQNVIGSYNIDGDLTVSGSSVLGNDGSADTNDFFGRTRIRTHASQTGMAFAVRNSANSADLFSVDLTGALTTASAAIAALTGTSATLTGALATASASVTNTVTISGGFNTPGAAPTRYLGFSALNCMYSDSTAGQVILSSSDVVIGLDSDNSNTGRSFSIRNNAAYATNGTEIFRIDEGGRVNVMSPTLAGNASCFVTTANGDAVSNIEITNGSGSAGEFLPVLQFNTSTNNPTYIVSRAQTDSGSLPVLTQRVRTIAGAAIATRPTFRWENLSTNIMELNAVGDLTLARSIKVGAGYGLWNNTYSINHGIFLNDADEIELRTNKHFTIQLDKDNNGTDGLFRVRSNNVATDLFTISETGAVTLTSGATLGLNANHRLSFATDASLYSTGDIIMRLDADNNGTNVFRVQSGAGTDVLTVSEAGAVVASSSVTATSLISSGTVSATNLKYVTLTITAGSTSATWTHNYGSTNYSIGSTASGTGTHVAYANKGTNAIDLILDAPLEVNVDVMVILLGS